MSLMLAPRSCSSCSGVICENIAKASASFPGWSCQMNINFMVIYFLLLVVV